MKLSRNTITLVTITFGVAVILSGLYRYFMEPGGIKGLWFGLVMGGVALAGAFVMRTRLPIIGLLLAAVVALFVGGWFCFENFAQGKHELRMYLMIVVSAVELAVIGLGWLGRKTK